MNKFQKISIAVSCFSPLYVILAFKNTLQVFDLLSVENFNWKSCNYIYNISLVGIWLICLLVGTLGILAFKKTFLSAYEKPSEKVTIECAENVTSDYYFTYFSLFILTFFTIDPTIWSDIVILALLMIFIIWVYVSNEMWFINPVLNVIGYKSFKLIYSKPSVPNKQFEIRVFAKDNLSKEIYEDTYISYSQHDFSICYKKKPNKVK